MLGRLKLELGYMMRETGRRRGEESERERRR